MAKCAYCGAETELYYAQAPICVKCSEKLERKGNPPARLNDYTTHGFVPEDLKRSG